MVGIETIGIVDTRVMRASSIRQAQHFVLIGHVVCMYLILYPNSTPIPSWTHCEQTPKSPGKLHWRTNACQSFTAQFCTMAKTLGEPLIPVKSVGRTYWTMGESTLGLLAAPSFSDRSEP